MPKDAVKLNLTQKFLNRSYTILVSSRLSLEHLNKYSAVNKLSQFFVTFNLEPISKIAFKANCKIFKMGSNPDTFF